MPLFGYNFCNFGNFFFIIDSKIYFSKNKTMNITNIFFGVLRSFVILLEFCMYESMIFFKWLQIDYLNYDKIVVF